MTYMMCLNFQE